MGRADYYAPGDWNAICDMCGSKYKASQLRKTWDGFYNCPSCWEPRHPQEFVRGVQDIITPPWTRPGGADILLAQCDPTKSSGIAGYATAGCATPELRPPGFDELVPGVEVLLVVTNLLTRSEEFDHADWVKGAGVTVTPNTDVAPDGTLSVDTVTFPSAGGFEVIYHDATLGIGTFAWSIWLSGNGTVHIDGNVLSGNTGVTLTTTLTRYNVILTNSVSASKQIRLISYPGDTATTIKVWGAQLEQASTVGNYVKTINAPATQTFIT